MHVTKIVSPPVCANHSVTADFWGYYYVFFKVQHDSRARVMLADQLCVLVLLLSQPTINYML